MCYLHENLIQKILIFKRYSIEEGVAKYHYLFLSDIKLGNLKKNVSDKFIASQI